MADNPGSAVDAGPLRAEGIESRMDVGKDDAILQDSQGDTSGTCGVLPDSSRNHEALSGAEARFAERQRSLRPIGGSVSSRSKGMGRGGCRACGLPRKTK